MIQLTKYRIDITLREDHEINRDTCGVLIKRLNMEQFDMLNVMLSNKTKPANEMNLLKWINFLNESLLLFLSVSYVQVIEIFTEIFYFTMTSWLTWGCTGDCVEHGEPGFLKPCLSPPKV